METRRGSPCSRRGEEKETEEDAGGGERAREEIERSLVFSELGEQARTLQSVSVRSIFRIRLGRARFVAPSALSPSAALKRRVFARACARRAGRMLQTRLPRRVCRCLLTCSRRKRSLRFYELDACSRSRKNSQSQRGGRTA